MATTKKYSYWITAKKGLAELAILGLTYLITKDGVATVTVGTLATIVLNFVKNKFLK